MAYPDWLTARPIAHRGLHDAARGIIENTPSAFQAAVDHNYGIECDVQISADGEAMVHHDEALGRLNDGSGALATLASSDLKRIPYKTTADPMITLGELCDLVAGRVLLLIELKSLHDNDERLPRRIADVLAKYRGPVAAMSFDPLQVAGLRMAAPDLLRGLTAARRSASTEAKRVSAYLGHLIAARPQFLAYGVKDFPSVPPVIARHVFRKPILTWTVRSDEDRRRAARYADQIIFEGFLP